MRVCRVCGATGEDVKFHRLTNRCRGCFNKYMKEWRSKNVEHLKEYRRREDVKLDRRDATQRWLDSHKKERAAWRRKRYAALVAAGKCGHCGQIKRKK